MTALLQPSSLWTDKLNVDANVVYRTVGEVSEFGAQQ
ncbi:hypothetical protein FQN60_007803 [Etheostoma spectabile]|uniref:Uncharacterized protein n=1 Tax=Etheostoma spectabile TaxID=54343 RepID=A0A5J5CYK5_9PERO|nr:hypothetical protein FQN60_007803 [Etheostoma spectabile]